MALRVSFSTSQLFGECNCFTFEDITGVYSSTNKGGYGAPNLEKADITKTEIYITTADGIKYKVNRSYLPTRLPIKICTSDLVEFEETEAVVDTGCGCSDPVPVYQPQICPEPILPADCSKSSSVGNLKDGCLLFEYYVFAMSSVKTVCNYLVKDIVLQTGQKLWVNKNGTMVDVSDQIDDINDLIKNAFYVEQTNDIYSEWQVRNGDVIELCGFMEKSNCVEEALEEEEEVIVSYSIKNVVFHCNTEYKLSNLTYKINIDENGCTNCLQNGMSKDQANCMIAIAWAKLQSIKNNPGCNCTCIQDNFKQIQNIISMVYGDC